MRDILPLHLDYDIFAIISICVAGMTTIHNNILSCRIWKGRYAVVMLVVQAGG